MFGAQQAQTAIPPQKTTDRECGSGPRQGLQANRIRADPRSHPHPPRFARRSGQASDADQRLFQLPADSGSELKKCPTAPQRRHTPAANSPPPDSISQAWTHASTPGTSSRPSSRRRRSHAFRVAIALVTPDSLVLDATAASLCHQNVSAHPATQTATRSPVENESSAQANRAGAPPTKHPKTLDSRRQAHAHGFHPTE